MGSKNNAQEERNAFSSLAIWRSKVSNDLDGVPRFSDFKLRYLLEHTKELEQAVYGCLKHALYEAEEARAWGLLSEEFVSMQRVHLYAQAAQELVNDKAYMLEMAREHNMSESYKKEVQQPLQHTVGDYETLGQLRFGLLVWKANLGRDLSITETPENILKEAWTAAVQLVDRCIKGSLTFWTAQQSESLPNKEEVEAVRQAALAKAKKMLDEEAKTHHVEWNDTRVGGICSFGGKSA